MGQTLMLSLLLLLLLQMCEDGGSWSDAALQQLEQAGYSDVMRLEGGYAGWGQVCVCHCWRGLLSHCCHRHSWVPAFARPMPHRVT
jgi:hypothetical protein